MEQVTIVVPFYNVALYIGDCLDSLLRQTHKNIEILCIDDFSPDNSLAVVEQYAVKDQRIRIIRHKENKGLGGARNTGIKYATSNYICFLDSDDYVSDNYVEMMYQAIIKDNSDVAICNMLSDEAGLIAPYGANYKDEVFVLSENKGNTLDIAMCFNPGCTNKIYRRDLLVKNNIFQPERRYYEDVLFWLISVYHSCRISSISDRLHYYRQRSDSIMNTLTFKHIDDRLIFIRQIDTFVKNNILPTSNIDAQKTLDDTMSYILRHLRYGQKLIDDACVENKANINKYYDNEIISFSLDCDWPTLPTAYKR